MLCNITQHSTKEQEATVYVMNHITDRRHREWLLLLLGCIVTSVGVSLLKDGRIVTGGSAGLALSLSYLFHLKFPIMFMLINLPFFVFAWFSMGRSFTFRTVAAIALLSSFTAVEGLLPNYRLPLISEAGTGGALIGIGICMLFKSGASLGGSTILALYLHRRFGRDPGKTVFLLDLVVILTSLSAISLGGALTSGLSLAITGTVVSQFTGRQNASRSQAASQSSATATAGS